MMINGLLRLPSTESTRGYDEVESELTRIYDTIDISEFQKEIHIGMEFEFNIKPENYTTRKLNKEEIKTLNKYLPPYIDFLRHIIIPEVFKIKSSEFISPLSGVYAIFYKSKESGLFYDYNPLPTLSGISIVIQKAYNGMVLGYTKKQIYDNIDQFIDYITDFVRNDYQVMDKFTLKIDGHSYTKKDKLSKRDMYKVGSKKDKLGADSGVHHDNVEYVTRIRNFSSSIKRLKRILSDISSQGYTDNTVGCHINLSFDKMKMGYLDPMRYAMFLKTRDIFETFSDRETSLFIIDPKKYFKYIQRISNVDSDMHAFVNIMNNSNYLYSKDSGIHFVTGLMRELRIENRFFGGTGYEQHYDEMANYIERFVKALYMALHPEEYNDLYLELLQSFLKSEYYL